ncbi:efflux transporter outer membrane subunit [Marinobacter salarius]|uniref:efflux transporter outer membrane subunit n=1 Tax=Marinobacter TaxID=2742 RepID=UPI001D188609|nr:efflux transporter outer membrane subunit [Marinobacter salarius]MCC4284165.1 efflux transporter outer membrane subunit [Marinobacter salarius]MDP4534397.1 efflux transporter outer membrane subunit [Marinobacter salarius]
MSIDIRKNSFRALVLAVAAVTLSGCATTSPIDRPELAIGEAWNAPEVVTVNTVPPDSLWWQAFGSAELDRLILQAFEQSPDLAAMAERVFQAEQQARIAGSSLLPSLNLNGSTGARLTDGEGTSRRSESTSATLSANYELDVWGNLAASREEAEASFRATTFDYDTVRLTLASSVATTWFQLLALEEQLRVARENLDIAERTEQIVGARYRNGAASRAELLRQQTEVLNQRAGLVPLQLQYRQTRSALAVLVGVSPLGFNMDTADKTLLAMVLPSVDAGVPSDLLIRRPDLARDEARLQAADANVEQARTAFLPSVSLGLSAGASSADLLTLVNPVETAGWTMSLAQTLFDGGRLDAQQAISESQRLELVESYRSAILIALQETDDALDRVQTSQHREELQQTINERAARTLELTELRYREGSDELMTLLDAQRTLFQTRDQLVQLRLARLVATVDLYKALGGGWKGRYRNEVALDSH